MSRKKDAVDEHFEQKEKEQPIQPGETRFNNDGSVKEKGEDKGNKQ